MGAKRPVGLGKNDAVIGAQGNALKWNK